MITTNLFPGRYVQGADAIKRLGTELARLGEHGMLLVDPFVYEELLEDFREDAEDGVDLKIEKFNGECCDKEINRLIKVVDDNMTFVCGVGGGKTLDTAKAVAHHTDNAVAVVPTLASTDAPTSALAVIYSEDGAFDRYLFLPRNPDLVLLDTRIAAQAPARFLVSGMGDALATWFEADACRQTHADNMAGDPGSRSAWYLARLCYDTLLEYGTAALAACEGNGVTPALEFVTEANTLLSGLGFESGGLGSAHSIHNGLTVLEDTHDCYHGEKVAFGVLAGLFLGGRDAEDLNEVYDFCESVGLPTTLEGIGLKKVSDEELLQVGERSCADEETIHNEPWPIEAIDVANALRAADAYGQARKQ